MCCVFFPLQQARAAVVLTVNVIERVAAGVEKKIVNHYGPRAKRFGLVGTYHR